ncbi:uncharacterized protein LOC133391638 [Anopheles gambiae]|uniref:uncharacterized protein LOC133391638 n=2 Tax=Anopheles gambiae TaxID=7165 RepID=UPI002AC91986|nr:uncharacterized protein LOC133391638 [Anopheles gambiae]
MPSKKDMLCALENAKVPVPPTATIAQIRMLYEELFPRSHVVAEQKLAPEVTHESVDTGDLAIKQMNDEQEIVKTANSGGLETELETLQKELQVLELRQKIAMLKSSNIASTSLPSSSSPPPLPLPTAQPVPPSLTSSPPLPLPLPTVLPVYVPNFEDFIGKFSGERGGVGVEHWFREFEQVCSLYTLNDQLKFFCMRRLLTDTAAIFAKTSGACTYETLKADLISTFTSKTSLEEVFKKLRARHLSQHESITRYVLEMQQIAGTVIPEEDLVNIIIDGIDDPINTSSIRFAAKSLEHLKTLLKKYETFRQTRGVTPTPAPLRTKPPAPPRSTGPSRQWAQNNNNEPARCFNCSQFGHYQSACPMPRRPKGSCFKCHQMGHTHRECRNFQPVTTAAVHHLGSHGFDEETADQILLSEIETPTQTDN